LTNWKSSSAISITILSRGRGGQQRCDRQAPHLQCFVCRHLSPPGQYFFFLPLSVINSRVIQSVYFSSSMCVRFECITGLRVSCPSSSTNSVMMRESENHGCRPLSSRSLPANRHCDTATSEILHQLPASSRLFSLYKLMMCSRLQSRNSDFALRRFSSI